MFFLILEAFVIAGFVGFNQLPLEFFVHFGFESVMEDGRLEKDFRNIFGPIHFIA